MYNSRTVRPKSTFGDDDEPTYSSSSTIKRVGSGGARPLLGSNTQNLKQAGQNKVLEYAEQKRLQRERAEKIKMERKMMSGEDYSTPPTQTQLPKRNSSSETKMETKFEDDPYEDKYSSAIKSVAKPTRSAPTPPVKQQEPEPVIYQATNTKRPIINNRAATNSTSTNALTPYDLMRKKITLKNGGGHSQPHNVTNGVSSHVNIIPSASRQMSQKPIPVASNSIRSRNQQPESEDEDEYEDTHYQPTTQKPPSRPTSIQKTQQKPTQKIQQQPAPAPSQQIKPPSVNSSASFKGMSQDAPMMDEYPDDSVDVELEECPICNRSFRPQILARHKKTCLAAKNKVVKTFKVSVVPDELKQDSEKAKRESAALARSQPKPKPKKVAKWRLEHESFMNALKANKSGQPAPSNPELDDRVQCPHCQRKFADLVAERHIPKCASQQHKPTFLKRGLGLAGGNLSVKSPTSPSRPTASSTMNKSMAFGASSKQSSSTMTIGRGKYR
ncbi:zinc finger C2HC domain-containing protein [Acrasis kona]|uniref:Zinc finger C2HC domain-containing protein n=1 Tax=Acrasis kona TaxID=1008807 RepID=A0AAW2ZSG3_9EUKA